MNVNEITRRTSLSRPAISHHLKILKDAYGVEEEDFLSAEIEIVPAGPARDYGFDRSMIMGYGHDDRVCAYPSFSAIVEMENRSAPAYAFWWIKKKSVVWEQPVWSPVSLKT